MNGGLLIMGIILTIVSFAEEDGFLFAMGLVLLAGAFLV